MTKIDIIPSNLEFKEMNVRSETNRIILHHLGIVDAEGNVYNRDMTAEEIHQEHLNNGWSGIGYHFIVHKDGTIEQGRPEEYVGSHAEGSNWDSIGIVVAGTFMDGYEPTDAQIESTAKLCAYICNKYGLDIENGTETQFIFGHRDVCATECPGDLYSYIPEIKGKTIWYLQN